MNWWPLPWRSKTRPMKRGASFAITDAEVEDEGTKWRTPH